MEEKNLITNNITSSSVQPEQFDTKKITWQKELSSADAEINSPVNIKVIGVGGGGMNAVDFMLKSNLVNVSFIAINTDEQVLNRSQIPNRIKIGTQLTKGMGVGGDPELGLQAALEDEDILRELFIDTDMVFITAGMGGGTGTGAAPLISRLAKEQGALVLGVATLPFKMEGMRRMQIAEEGLYKLRQEVDSLITIKNEAIFKVVEESTPIRVAFSLIDSILFNAVRGISDLVNGTGLVNVDFADLRSIVSSSGDAILATGEGIGKERVKNALEEAFHNVLLDGDAIEGATAVLINISGGADLGMHEWKKVTEEIISYVDSSANIIVGLSLEEELREAIRIIVVATGFTKKGKSTKVKFERNQNKPSKFIEIEKSTKNISELSSSFSKRYEAEGHKSEPVKQRKFPEIYANQPAVFKKALSSEDLYSKDPAVGRSDWTESLEDLEKPAFLRRRRRKKNNA